MTVTVEARAVGSDDAWLPRIPAGALVIARSLRRLPAPVRVALEIARDYHAWLDAPVDGGVAERIADDILRIAAERDAAEIVYLLGPSGAIGDDTVRRLSQRASVTGSGGTVPAVGGATLVVDALALADARAAAPFDAGLVPLDPAATLVVTNWYGDGVTAAASDYLRSRLGAVDLEQPNNDGCVVVPANASAGGTASLAQLRQVYARLRRPDGCPWDREQTETSTLDYIAEEVGELREALEAGAWPHAAEELGDILGNLIMVAQIAEEHGRFRLEDTITALSDKLVRRHPHVFGDEQAASPDEVLAIWNRVKRQEDDGLDRGGSRTE